MSTEKRNIKIKISDVKAMLVAGKTRPEIAEHYGITMNDLKKQVFSHPELKFKKTHKASASITLVDDEETENADSKSTCDTVAKEESPVMQEGPGEVEENNEVASTENQEDPQMNAPVAESNSETGTSDRATW